MEENLSTTDLHDYVARCEDISEFKSILANLTTQREEWIYNKIC